VMELILLLILIGLIVCYFIRHPIKSMKYVIFLLTFFIVGCIVIIAICYLLMIQVPFN
jgi:hypothetical protein